MQTRFDAASAKVWQMTSKPGDDIMLTLYALYKQATVGDVSGSRPSFMDPRGRAKYDAWSKVKGLTKAEAMATYVTTVEKLTAED